MAINHKNYWQRPLYLSQMNTRIGNLSFGAMMVHCMLRR